MGPGVTSTNLAAWEVLGLSSGTGEPYVFDIAIDVYWLKYLRLANRIDEKTITDVLERLNNGNASQLVYVKFDKVRVSLLKLLSTRCMYRYNAFY